VVDSGPALQSARSFVVPDTIIDIPGSLTPITHLNDAAIAADVRQHFIALGWRDAAGDPDPHPDVLVLLGASTRIQTGFIYGDWFSSWGYLPYWGAGVDGSWAWGAPAAYPYAFPAGTLVITMLDLRQERADTKTIPLLWAAGIDGVLTTTEGTIDRAQLGLDQAFAQSDYLRIP